MAAIRFYLLSRRLFSAHTKSSLIRIDKRTARAARNTRYRYSKNGPLDHKMADNCVSLARTNTVSSTITKPIKTWKTSNKSYSYNLLNHINKMYTHDLFYLQQKWEAWLLPVYKQIRTTKSSTQNYFNWIKTTFHYYSLIVILNKARHADNGYKKNGSRKAFSGTLTHL